MRPASKAPAPISAPDATTHLLAIVSPLVGIAAFLPLMGVALALFPGGNRFHPDAAGYSFFDNFWCDLFDDETYAGVANGGRLYATAASVVLFLSMVPLWWELPKSFRKTPRMIKPTQICGSLGMLSATLVPTSWHDRAIDAAGPLGGTAYLLMLIGLWRHGRKPLALLGLTPLALATLNFVLWAGQRALHAIPAIQKLAFLSFLIWIGGLARAEARLRRGP